MDIKIVFLVRLNGFILEDKLLITYVHANVICVSQVFGLWGCRVEAAGK